MKRTYSLAIEGEPDNHSAYVPELPAILVTGNRWTSLLPARMKRLGFTGTRPTPMSHRLRCCGRSKSSYPHNLCFRSCCSFGWVVGTAFLTASTLQHDCNRLRPACAVGC